MYRRSIGGLGFFVVIVMMTAPLFAQSNQKAIQEAIKLKKEGNVDAAISVLNKVLKSNPRDGEAHYALAWALIAKKKKEEAATHFEKAIAARISGDKLTEAQTALQRMGKTVPMPTASSSGGKAGGKSAASPAVAGKSSKATGPSPAGAPAATGMGKAPGAPPGAPGAPSGKGTQGGLAAGPPGSPSGSKMASAPPGAVPDSKGGSKGESGPGAPPGAGGEGKSKAEPAKEPEKRTLPVWLVVGVPAAILLAILMILQTRKKKKG